MKKLKLTSLNRSAISNYEMEKVIGGHVKAQCGCSCYYSDEGYSYDSNGSANSDSGFTSKKGINYPYPPYE